MVMKTIKSIIVFVSLASAVVVVGVGVILVFGALLVVFPEGIALVLLLSVVLGVAALMAVSFMKALELLADHGWLW